MKLKVGFYLSQCQRVDLDKLVVFLYMYWIALNYEVFSCACMKGCIMLFEFISFKYHGSPFILIIIYYLLDL